MEISKSEASAIVHALSIVENEVGLEVFEHEFRIRLVRYIGDEYLNRIGHFESELAKRIELDKLYPE
jgi:hypothetical protein